MGIAERIAITRMVTAKNFAMMLRPPVTASALRCLFGNAAAENWDSAAVVESVCLRLEGEVRSLVSLPVMVTSAVWVP